MWTIKKNDSFSLHLRPGTVVDLLLLYLYDIIRGHWLSLEQICNEYASQTINILPESSLSNWKKASALKARISKPGFSKAELATLPNPFSKAWWWVRWWSCVSSSLALLTENLLQGNPNIIYFSKKFKLRIDKNVQASPHNMPPLCYGKKIMVTLSMHCKVMRLQWWAQVIFQIVRVRACHATTYSYFTWPRPV